MFPNLHGIIHHKLLIVNSEGTIWSFDHLTHLNHCNLGAILVTCLFESNCYTVFRSKYVPQSRDNFRVISTFVSKIIFYYM